MTTIQERLRRFASVKGLSMTELERVVGLGNGASTRIGENSRQKTFSRIATTFPDLNLDWLRTGDGEMLRPVVTQTTHGDSSPAINGDENTVVSGQDSSEPFGRFMDELASQRDLTKQTLDMLSQRDTQVDRLITLLETMVNRDCARHDDGTR